jgi:hypothetical protein
VPRQEIIYAGDLVVGDAGQRIGEPSLRVHTIQLGGLDQGVGDGGGAAAGLRSDEQVVLASDGQFPFILPMSGRFIGFIIDGMPILART